MRNTRQESGDRDEFKEPATRIVAEVARAKGVDVLDLEPLFETIDPDALDALLVNADRGVAVAFEYEGWTVRIRGDGQIFLDA